MHKLPPDGDSCLESDLIYQVFVKTAEPRSSPMRGPFSFPTTEARQEYVSGPDIYWYHYAEEDDWHLWRRGGAWQATSSPGPADRQPVPPEITEDDRW